MWRFDALDQPISDTTSDTSADPERSTGGTGLSPSPADALARNTSGYCDFLDANGRSLGGGSTPVPRTAFVRRWSIEPLPKRPNTLVIQVLVLPLLRGLTERPPGAARSPDEARILGLKTRRAS